MPSSVAGISIVTFGMAIAFSNRCAASIVFGVSLAKAIGTVASPEQQARNYDMRMAYGSLAAGGTLGFLIPRSVGVSIANTGGIEAALLGFLAFYAACAGLTWWCYLRSRVLAVRMPSLAHAQV